MKITRRSFHALTASALALTALSQIACKRKPPAPGSAPGSAPATQPAPGSFPGSTLKTGPSEPRKQGQGPGEIANSKSQIENASTPSSPSDRPSTPGDEVLAAGELVPKPFEIGGLERYIKPGLYAEFRGRGVWLVSDGKRLIALSAVCPHLQCLVKWEAQAQQFACPCHASHFRLDGTNEPGMKAKRPLERCKLELVDTAVGRQVRVDPRTVFVKDKTTDEFDQPGAFLPLM